MRPLWQNIFKLPKTGEHFFGWSIAWGCSTAPGRKIDLNGRKSHDNLSNNYFYTTFARLIRNHRSRKQGCLFASWTVERSVFCPVSLRLLSLKAIWADGDGTAQRQTPMMQLAGSSSPPRPIVYLGITKYIWISCFLSLPPRCAPSSTNSQTLHQLVASVAVYLKD